MTEQTYRIVPAEPSQLQKRRGADACSFVTHAGAEAVYQEMVAAAYPLPPGTLLRVHADGTASKLDTEAEVERIARTIYEQEDGDLTPWPSLFEAEQLTYRRQARAAYAALERGDG